MVRIFNVLTVGLHSALSSHETPHAPSVVQFCFIVVCKKCKYMLIGSCCAYASIITNAMGPGVTQVLFVHLGIVCVPSIPLSSVEQCLMTSHIIGKYLQICVTTVIFLHSGSALTINFSASRLENESRECLKELVGCVFQHFLNSATCEKTALPSVNFCLFTRIFTHQNLHSILSLFFFCKIGSTLSFNVSCSRGHKQVLRNLTFYRNLKMCQPHL